MKKVIDLGSVAYELSNVLKHNPELLENLDELKLALECRLLQAYQAGLNGDKLVEKIEVKQGPSQGAVTVITPPTPYLSYSKEKLGA